MRKQTRIAALAAGLLALLACLTAPAQSAGYWNYDEELMDDRTFQERKLSAVDASSQGHHSMFAWDLYFFNSGAYQRCCPPIKLTGYIRKFPHRIFRGRSFRKW